MDMSSQNNVFAKYIVDVHRADNFPEVKIKQSSAAKLIIRRVDGLHLISPSDIDEIKNKIFGESVMALEVYPGTKRVCDLSNRTVLFCFAKIGEVINPSFPVRNSERVSAVLDCIFDDQ